MKRLEKTAYILILLTIILLNIFIGSNIKDPIWIVQEIVLVFTTIYLIAKKIHKEKNLIIKGKIDVAVLIFMIAVFLPLIFNTYVTKEGTINFILKYWSVYAFYLLIRNNVNTKEKIDGIIKTLIISSIIPIIFGFDKLLKLNIFEGFLNLINAVKIEDTRMISIFGYANTLAAYLGLTTSLAIGRFLNVDKKISKILYAIYIVLSSITIILTQSKFVLALIALIILIFIIIGIKNKKISKKWIIIGFSLIIMFFVYFFIAINISKPLKIGEEKNCVVRGIDKSTTYNLEFDIEAKTDKPYDAFEIYIVEVTRYFSEKTIGKLTFSEFSGTKQIQIETSNIVDHLEIRFKNLLNQELTINDFRINGDKYILEYKIIPDEIVRVFTTFNFKNSSVWQRADYWSDSIEIIKDNWLIGAGGNTWRMLYGQNQDYLYYAKECHSYVLEVFMSFGIIGIVSYLFILAILIKTILELKEKNKKDKKEQIKLISILAGLSIIIVHSFMDFDMSYLIIEMIFFMFIAAISNLNSKDKEQNKDNYKKVKWLDNVVIIIFILIFITNTLGLIARVLEDETGRTSKNLAPWVTRYRYNEIVYLENNNLETENKIKYIKEYIKDEPYSYQNIMYEILSNNILKSINEVNVEDKINDIKFLKNTLQNVEMERKYDVGEIQKRADIIVNFAEGLINKSEELKNVELKNEANEIVNILLNEYKEKAKLILEYTKNGEMFTIANMRHDTYIETVTRAKKIIEK